MRKCYPILCVTLTLYSSAEGLRQRTNTAMLHHPMELSHTLWDLSFLHVILPRYMIVHTNSSDAAHTYLPLSWLQILGYLNGSDDKHTADIRTSGFSCGNHQPKIFLKYQTFQQLPAAFVSGEGSRKLPKRDATQPDKLLQQYTYLDVKQTAALVEADVPLVSMKCPCEIS